MRHRLCTLIWPRGFTLIAGSRQVLCTRRVGCYRIGCTVGRSRVLFLSDPVFGFAGYVTPTTVGGAAAAVTAATAAAAVHARLREDPIEHLPAEPGVRELGGAMGVIDEVRPSGGGLSPLPSVGEGTKRVLVGVGGGGGGGRVLVPAAVAPQDLAQIQLAWNARVVPCALA